MGALYSRTSPKPTASLTMERETGKQDEKKENIWKNYFFHHQRPLEFSSYETVTQKRGFGEDFEGAYEWVERQVGYYPLFLSVGNTSESVLMTGYQNQWQKKLKPVSSIQPPTRNESDNRVLFSFKDIQNGIFMDYVNWHIVLNSQYTNYNLKSRDIQSIFRPSFSKVDWLRFAAKNPSSVQLVVPGLDLTKADHVFVRNQNTLNQLQKMGFNNVAVQRLKVEGL